MGQTCSSSPCCSENLNYLALVHINGVPGVTEEELYRECESELKESENILRAIEEYKGCQELARAAMSNPVTKTQQAAFEGLLPAVDQINDFLEYSQAMTRCYQKLLTKLSEQVPQGKRFAQLSNRPGLTHQLTAILDFALQFDQFRMMQPNVSNDFSYYKRLLSKFQETSQFKHRIKHTAENEDLQKFIQSSTPMTFALKQSTEEVCKNSPGCVFVLSTIANAYLAQLGKKEPYNSQEELARAMTLAVVLFDYVDGEGGAFVKRSPIKIRAIIKLLKHDWDPQPYLRTIQFSSVTYRSAPNNIQELFD